MRQTLTLIILLCCFAVEAQKTPIKFGDIPIETVKMTTFAADSTAEAVVLADYGETTIRYNQTAGFEMFFERTRRIKVLTEAGKKWADFSIQLYQENDLKEKLIMIKGVTVNLENGKAVESKMKNDAIFREMYSKNIELVKVTLPNVQVGSVIDLTYKTSSTILFNLQDWEFQTTIPVVWSEYRVAIPEYFNYDKYMQGYIAPQVVEQTVKQNELKEVTNELFSRENAQQVDRLSYKENNYRWVATDVPPFRDEPFMTTRNDYISRINFELATIKYPGEALRQVTGSWAAINKRFAESEDFLGEVTGNGFLKKIVDDLTAGVTDNAQKVDKVYNYVRQNIAWNGESRRFTDNSLRQVLEQKKGSSAEINLLLASMIEKTGISVKPVLLSTRDHGFIREATPASSQFNYVVCIARWENTQVLLDATESYLPAGVLPSRCLNGKGMAVSLTGPEWVALEAPKSRSVTDTELALSPDGVLTGTLKMEHGGYRALEKRKKYLSDGVEAYSKQIVGARQWQLTNSQYTNANEFREAFKESHDIAINEHITVAGDVMYMNPFISEQWSSNPFKSEKREYPVDFGNSFDEVYMLKLKIPEGFAVDELPATKIFALPANAARYTMTTAVTGDVVSVVSRLTLNKVLFTTLEYVALREFCNQVVAKQTEQIVIKKK